MAPSVATPITLHDSRQDMPGLLEWYDQNARALPWRVEKVTPWESLLAEIILQQTRMETGLPYWERIRKAYPTPAALAADTEENLLRLWQGCGYYARARNLYKLATTLDGDNLPQSYDALLKLPGIGPYTAAAIASMSFGEPVACVDGNVRRVISRLRAEHLSDADLQNEANALLNHERPGDWNQAMMEIGSLVCTPRNPECGICPLESTCMATRSSNPEQWPLRRSTKQAHVDATALIVSGEGGFLLEAREGRTLGGLWGLPYAEGEVATSTLLKNREAEKIGHVRHDFTHKRLNITVYISQAKDGDELRHPDSVPMATLDRKVLNFHRGYLGEQS
jgi:A/G-specific adenine glycosylase